MIAKVFLLLSLFSILLVARNFEKFRFRIYTRIAFSLLVLVSIIAIIFPEFSGKAAELVGVGRGSDLVFYLSTLGQIGLVAVLIAKFREVDGRLNMLVREISLLREQQDVKSKRSSKKP